MADTIEERVAYALRLAHESGADTDFTELDIYELEELAEAGEWEKLAEHLDKARDPRWQEAALAADVGIEERKRARRLLSSEPPRDTRAAEPWTYAAIDQLIAGSPSCQPRANTVYLAARYSRRGELANCRAALASFGYIVTSRWLDGDHELTPDDRDGAASAQADDDSRLRFALEDWQDLRSAETLIAFTEEPRTHNGRGGRHVELGAALALGLRTIVCGPRENVFCHLPQVAHAVCWEEALTHLLQAAPPAGGGRPNRCRICSYPGDMTGAKGLWICGRCFALHDAVTRTLVDPHTLPQTVRRAVYAAMARHLPALPGAPAGKEAGT